MSGEAMAPGCTDADFFLLKAGRSSDDLTRTQVPMITVEGNL